MLPIDVVKKFSLFEGIEDSLIQQLAQHMYAKSFKRLEYVVRQGDASRELLFLIRGQLQVIDLAESGREVGIAFVKENDFFGELSVIDGMQRSASVLAVQPSVVGYLPRHLAQQFLYKHPLGSERVIQRLANKIRRTTQVRSMIAAGNSVERVAGVLSSIGVKKPDGTIIVERLPTQNQVAVMANLARETVARALAQLKKEGALQSTGVPKQVIIKLPSHIRLPAANSEANKLVASQSKDDDAD